MLYRVVALSLLFAATAHAQAPGEMEPTAPMAPQGPAIVVPARPSVMANRWAVGLSIGSMGVAPDSQPDAKHEFGVGELALRYRATLHLELEVAFGGGREKLADGSQGDNEAKTGMLSARYRFAPESAWNWYLMLGIGGISVASHTATDQERKDAERPMGTYGIGVERRFERFALQAELRGIGVGQNDTAQTTPVALPPNMTGGTTTTMPPPPTPPPTGLTPEHQSGGQITIGASYYF